MAGFIREVRTVFTAQAGNLRAVARGIQKDVSEVGKTSQTSSKQASASFKDMETSLGRVEKAIEKSGNPKAFKDLTTVIKDTRKEFEETGKVSVENQKKLQNVLKDSRSDLALLGNSGSESIKEIETAIKGAEQEFQRFSSNQHLDPLQKKVESLQRSLKDGWNDGASELKQLNTALQKVQEDFKRTGQVSETSLQGLGTAITASKSDLSRLGASGHESMNEIKKAAQSLETELKGLGDNSGLTDIAEDAERAGDAVASIGASANIGSLGSVFMMFGKIKMATLGLVGAITGAGIGVVKFIQQGDELQKSLNSLQQQTGATGKEMEGMEKSLINLYRSGYGESFDDLSESMAKAGQMTGQTGKALEDTTKYALMMQNSFKDMDVEESLRATDTMMKTFKISSKEAYTLMAQGAQEGANKNGKSIAA